MPLSGAVREPKEDVRGRRNTQRLQQDDAFDNATTTLRGVVLQQASVVDETVLADNSGGTSGGGTIAAVDVDITDPADTPATADALRDDLVTNTIPDIEGSIGDCRDAIATLAAYCTSLEDKINEMLANQRTAGQLNS